MTGPRTQAASRTGSIWMLSSWRRRAGCSSSRKYGNDLIPQDNPVSFNQPIRCSCLPLNGRAEMRGKILRIVSLAASAAGVLAYARYRREMRAIRTAVDSGSTIAETTAGEIEYAEIGE